MLSTMWNQTAIFSVIKAKKGLKRGGLFHLPGLQSQKFVAHLLFLLKFSRILHLFLDALQLDNK